MSFWTVPPADIFDALRRGYREVIPDAWPSCDGFASVFALVRALSIPCLVKQARVFWEQFDDAAVRFLKEWIPDYEIGVFVEDADVYLVHDRKGQHLTLTHRMLAVLRGSWEAWDVYPLETLGYMNGLLKVMEPFLSKSEKAELEVAILEYSWNTCDEDVIKRVQHVLLTTLNRTEGTLVVDAKQKVVPLSEAR